MAVDYSFGNWIKRRRKALNLTRQELAGQVGCSTSTIYKIESDERQPSRQIAELLAEYLEIPPDQRSHFIKAARRQRTVDQLTPPPIPYEPLPESPQIASKPNPPQAAVPLVGRSRELRQLEQAYRQAGAGPSRTVCLVGEAGMGKTRLAEDFLEWALQQPPPADVLRGRAFEVGGALPYQPIVDALRLRLEPETAPEKFLSEVWLAELSQLLPELRERFPGLPAPLAGEEDFVRARLFEAVARLGISLAARRPLILFIDDLQWADPGSLDLLHYLMQRWTEAGARTLLLLTVRQEGLMTLPALRNWLASLDHRLALDRVELSPLNQADLQELVHAIASNAPGSEPAAAQLAGYLLAETGGSPFFVNEALLMLHDQDPSLEKDHPGGFIQIDAASMLQRIQPGGRLPVPPNVRQVILARVARLSDKAQALLLSGAVIGRNCSFERLCQVARLDPFDALPALEEILQSRIMLETNAEPRPFTFSHDKIRDVVYTEAGATRRRLFHRQAFAVFEAAGAAPAELAFHAEAARLDEPTFRCSLAAGDEAMAVHAYAGALDHYRRALDLIEQVPVRSDQRCHLASRYGRALELNGQYQAALAHYEAMFELGERIDDRALALSALVAQGTIRTTANVFSELRLAKSLNEQALSLAQELGDQSAEARVLWNLLNSCRMTHHNEEALAAGEQSLALASQLGLREQMAYTANDLVYVYMVVGDIDRTLTLVRMATDLWRELGNQPMLTDSLTSYANMLAWMGQYERALAAANEGMQIARSLENKWAQSNILTSFALVYSRQMLVDRAITAMEESIRLGKAAGFLGAGILMKAQQAQLRSVLGDSHGARRQAERAFSIADRFPLIYSAAAGTMALIEIEAGSLAEAERILDTLSDNLALDIFNGLTREFVSCRLLLARQKYQAALQLSCQVLAFVEARRLALFIPEYCRLKAEALIGLGQPEQAEEALEAAVNSLQATGALWGLWETAGLLAGLAQDRGDREAASRWREMARSAIHKIAAQIQDEQLRLAFLGRAQVRAILQVGRLS